MKSYYQLSQARTVVVQMVEDLLVGGHIALSEEGDCPHPVFRLVSEGEPTDYMPITHEQHRALQTLLDQFKKDKREENPNRD
jgi:hypothetical protein